LRRYYALLSLPGPSTPSVRKVRDAAVPVTDRLVDNQANYVAGIVPALDPAKTWRAEVRTYYSGSGHFLKNIRVITLNKDLSVVQ